MTSPDPSPIQASAETVKLVEELREASFSTGANAEDEHGFLGSYEKALARSERAESALLAHVAQTEEVVKRARRLIASYQEWHRAGSPSDETYPLNCFVWLCLGIQELDAAIPNATLNASVPIEGEAAELLHYAGQSAGHWEGGEFLVRVPVSVLERAAAALRSTPREETHG